MVPTKHLAALGVPRGAMQRLRVRRWGRRLSALDIGVGTDLTEGSIDAREAGSVLVGRDSVIRGTLVLERPEARVIIGNNSLINGSTTLSCSLGISVGDDVLVSFEVLIVDHDAHSMLRDERRGDLARMTSGRIRWERIAAAPIHIGDGAWIGARSTILKGVTIGEGAVIGAGSVVVRDVPAYSLAVGNPAVTARELPRM